MASAQLNRRCGCYFTKRRKMDGDDGPNESIVTLQPLNEHRHRHSHRHRHNDKYVSVLMTSFRFH